MGEKVKTEGRRTKTGDAANRQYHLFPFLIKILLFSTRGFKICHSRTPKQRLFKLNL